MNCTYSTTTVKKLTSLKKHIEVEKNDHQALENFLNKLKNSNIVDKLNVDANADPNLNFDRFMEHFMKLKEQHLPKKVVRFDRKKHKINPWLTAGILKSINSKDKLYKTLLQIHKVILQYYLILRHTKILILLDEVLCMQNVITIGMLLTGILPACRKTWVTINETLNRKKGKRDFSKKFKLTNGNTISEPKKIANAFNDFFVSIGDTGVLNTNRNIDFNQYMPLKTNCTLIFQEITVDNTRRIIDSLKPKTSTGVDSVSNKLLKLVEVGLLNSINNNSVVAAKINEAIANIHSITLLKFKSVVKSYIIDLYSYSCNIPNWYVCQI